MATFPLRSVAHEERLTANDASITVAFAFALLLGLPFLLLQAWAFAAPAIAPPERRAVRRLLTLAALLHGTDHRVRLLQVAMG